MPKVSLLICVAMFSVSCSGSSTRPDAYWEGYNENRRFTLDLIGCQAAKSRGEDPGSIKTEILSGVLVSLEGSDYLPFLEQHESCIEAAREWVEMWPSGEVEPEG